MTARLRYNTTKIQPSSQQAESSEYASRKTTSTTRKNQRKHSISIASTSSKCT